MNKSIVISKMIIKEYLNLKNEEYMSITKLHKLLYIVYGTYLYNYNSLLFKELPCCFEHGPLFKSVQKEYKNKHLDLTSKNQDIENIKDKEKIEEIIKEIIKIYGNYSKETLSKWSHREGSAWSKAYPESDYWGNTIKEKYIKEEFESLIK